MTQQLTTPPTSSVTPKLTWGNLVTKTHNHSEADMQNWYSNQSVSVI